MRRSKLAVAKKIIALNKFNSGGIFETETENVREVLKFYKITGINVMVERKNTLKILKLNILAEIKNKS